MIAILRQLKQEKNVSANKIVKRNSFTKSSHNTELHYSNFKSNTIKTRGKSTLKKKIDFCLYNWINSVLEEKIFTNVLEKKFVNLHYSDSIGFSSLEQVWKFNDVVRLY